MIAVANQRDGVGKTTTTKYLGIGLARQGKNVLLIDMEPQTNLTASLGRKNVDVLKRQSLMTAVNSNLPDLQTRIRIHAC